jgi:hypothetical protein
MKMPTSIKRFILSLWLFARLGQCRKIIRQAYFFSGFGDSDVESLNSMLEQSRILQGSIRSMLLRGRMDVPFLAQIEGFCRVIEVDLQAVTRKVPT